MSDDLKKVIQDCQAKAKELNENTDELNKRLETVEHALVSLRLGVSARVPFGKDGDKRFLTWGKDNSRWKLLYEVGDHQAGHTYELLTHVSRGVRLSAVKLLPILFQALLAAVEHETDKIKKACEEIDVVTDEIAFFTAGQKAAK